MQYRLHAAARTAATSATLFQKPAIGEPSRTESTELRGRIIRHLSHSTGRKKGMAEIEDAGLR